MRIIAAFLPDALVYAAAILGILGAHEMGHYLMCRRYDVDATLPFFLPFPSLAGTLGAVIKIREPFPSRNALFDIAIGGPIGGFVVLVPLLFWGMHLSNVTVLPPVTPGMQMFWLGEPLLFKLAKWWTFGPIPGGSDVNMHPVVFAAWFGMLATAMNLLPFGQLDGGHIAYAVFGPRARYLSMATLIVIGLLMIWSFSWISMALIMLAMAFFLGFRHPPIVDEGTPLDPRRRMVALVALAIFVLCFTPVPIQTFFGR